MSREHDGEAHSFDLWLLSKVASEFTPHCAYTTDYISGLSHNLWTSLFVILIIELITLLSKDGEKE